MPLIDRSYFAGGELNIPGQNRIEIQENIDMMIMKREPELLTMLLGIKMYQDFIAGLTEDPIQQKWTDLLQGVTYEESPDRLKKWRGLISVPFSTVGAVDASNTFEIVVGRGGPYDPVDGSSTVIIPPAFVGKEFIFEMRRVGQLGADEFSVTGNVLTLLPGTYGDNVFYANTSFDRYYYKLPTLAINQSTGDSKESLIANYVYYWYVRKTITQTTTVGEVKTKTENATRVIPSGKMERAWNEMVGWVHEMYCFLETRATDYPSLVRDNDRMWRPINGGNL